MLKLEIQQQEFFNDKTNEFFTVPKTTLSLEHSLLSISKWEAIHEKPFLKQDEKTTEELISYVKCMTLTPNVDDKVYLGLNASHFAKIKDYIQSPMTATTFTNRDNRPPSRQIITAELIYYKMIEHGIPFECQKWHLNRLLTLIRVCDIRMTPQKKMSKNDIFAQNKALNASRRAAMNSRG